ncbi:hypothetical protein Z043_108669, partial [Scleropages formosus]
SFQRGNAAGDYEPTSNQPGSGTYISGLIASSPSSYNPVVVKPTPSNFWLKYLSSGRYASSSAEPVLNTSGSPSDSSSSKSLNYQAGLPGYRSRSGQQVGSWHNFAQGSMPVYGSSQGGSGFVQVATYPVAHGSAQSSQSSYSVSPSRSYSTTLGNNGLAVNSGSAQADHGSGQQAAGFGSLFASGSPGRYAFHHMRPAASWPPSRSTLVPSGSAQSVATLPSLGTAQVIYRSGLGMSSQGVSSSAGRFVSPQGGASGQLSVPQLSHGVGQRPQSQSCYGCTGSPVSWTQGSQASSVPQVYPPSVQLIDTPAVSGSQTTGSCSGCPQSTMSQVGYGPRHAYQGMSVSGQQTGAWSQYGSAQTTPSQVGYGSSDNYGLTLGQISQTSYGPGQTTGTQPQYGSAQTVASDLGYGSPASYGSSLGEVAQTRTKSEYGYPQTVGLQVDCGLDGSSGLTLGQVYHRSSPQQRRTRISVGTQAGFGSAQQAFDQGTSVQSRYGAAQSSGSHTHYGSARGSGSTQNVASQHFPMASYSSCTPVQGVGSQPLSGLASSYGSALGLGSQFASASVPIASNQAGGSLLGSISTGCASSTQGGSELGSSQQVASQVTSSSAQGVGSQVDQSSTQTLGFNLNSGSVPSGWPFGNSQSRTYIPGKGL